MTVAELITELQTFPSPEKVLVTVAQRRIGVIEGHAIVGVGAFGDECGGEAVIYIAERITKQHQPGAGSD